MNNESFRRADKSSVFLRISKICSMRQQKSLRPDFDAISINTKSVVNCWLVNHAKFHCIGTRALFQYPPLKIPSFMFDLRVFTAQCVMLRCKR